MRSRYTGTISYNSKPQSRQNNLHLQRYQVWNCRGGGFEVSVSAVHLDTSVNMNSTSASTALLMNQTAVQQEWGSTSTPLTLRSPIQHNLGVPDQEHESLVALPTANIFHTFPKHSGTGNCKEAKQYTHKENDSRLCLLIYYYSLGTLIKFGSDRYTTRMT